MTCVTVLGLAPAVQARGLVPLGGPKWLPSKEPIELVPFSVNLSRIPAGDSIVQLDVAIDPVELNGLAVYAPTFSSSVLSFRLGGGNDGSFYSIGLVVTLASGCRLVEDWQIACELRAPVPVGGLFSLQMAAQLGSDGSVLLDANGQPLLAVVPPPVPFNALTVNGEALTVNGFPITIGGVD